jgi:hypothetical protein
MAAASGQLWQGPPWPRAQHFVKRSIQGPALGPAWDRTQFIMAPDAPMTPERFV